MVGEGQCWTSKQEDRRAQPLQTSHPATLPSLRVQIHLKNTWATSGQYSLCPNLQSSIILMPRNLGVALGSLFSPYSQILPMSPSPGEPVSLITIFSYKHHLTLPIRSSNPSPVHSAGAHTPIQPMPTSHLGKPGSLTGLGSISGLRLFSVPVA